MSCRGVHFAIRPDVAAALSRAEDDDQLMELVEQIEEDWDRTHLAESDKAWDAMHRALTDGTLEYGGGEPPLNHCVLGPRQLHEDDGYIISLVLPEEVRDVATALQAIDRDTFRERYWRLVPPDYAPEYGEDDCAYTTDYFMGVRALFVMAAENALAVLFTVDQ